MRKILLGVTGEMGSGKDTVAKYLVEKYGAKQFIFSQALRDVLDRLYIPQSRQNISMLSLKLREGFGQDILACVLKEEIDKGTSEFVVVDGIRRLADAKLKEKFPDLVLVYIETSLEARYERIVSRQQNAGDATKTFEEFKKDHELEAEKAVAALKGESQAVITNDSTLEALYQQVDAVVAKFKKEA